MACSRAGAESAQGEPPASYRDRQKVLQHAYIHRIVGVQQRGGRSQVKKWEQPEQQNKGDITGL